MEAKSYKKNLNEWRKDLIQEIHLKAELVNIDTNTSATEMFRKRRYKGIGEVVEHISYLALRLKHIGIVLDMIAAVSKSTMSFEQRKQQKSSSLISPQFRERLMLAVTSVNACYACSYAHARAALIEGISEDEVDTLLSGNVQNCPAEEQVALLYALHWAEHEGKPDSDMREKLIAHYGKNKATAIEFTMGSIRIGNYIGNTLEYLKFKQDLKKERKKRLRLS